VKAHHVERRQGVQLFGLRDPVVIGVLPQPQPDEDCIARVYQPVGVAAFERLVERRESEEAVGGGSNGRLRRDVAEEFPPAVDHAVAVAV
jgi:hypothetical protein